MRQLLLSGTRVPQFLPKTLELHREFKVWLGCVVGFTDSRGRNYTADVGVFKHRTTGEGPTGEDDTGDSGEEGELFGVEYQQGQQHCVLKYICV